MTNFPLNDRESGELGQFEESWTQTKWLGLL